MKDRVQLIVYLAAVVFFTSVHRPGLLGAGLVLVAMLAGRGLPALAKRALYAVLVFNLVVSVSYTFVGLYRGDFSAHYLLLMNLRVLLLTSLTLLLASRINPFRAFGFSRTLLYLVTLAYSQMLTQRRLLGEFRQALRSRSIVRPRLRDRYRHGAATGAFLMHKAVSDAGDIAQAMTSRGFFNDSR